MRLRAVLLMLAAAAAAAVCVRLGLWQVSRHAEKRAARAAMEAALAEPPVRIEAVPAPAESVTGRRVVAAGRYDETRQILLGARFHEGEPGVEVVTPLRLAGGAALLVNRGWLPAMDGSTARPQDFPEPGPVEVLGIAEPIGQGGYGFELRAVVADSVTLFSTRRLDLESLEPRLPYPLAPYLVRQSPGPGVPERPIRTLPKAHDPSSHLGYAVQWFAFAAILLGGGAVLARSSARPAR